MYHKKLCPVSLYISSHRFFIYQILSLKEWKSGKLKKILFFSLQYSQEAPIVTVFPDGGTINQQFEPLSDPNLAKNTVPIDAQSNCRSHIKQKMNNTENYATYVDVDIEKGKLEVPKAKCADETAGNLKMDDSLVVSLFMVLLKRSYSF